MLWPDHPEEGKISIFATHIFSWLKFGHYRKQKSRAFKSPGHLEAFSYCSELLTDCSARAVSNANHAYLLACWVVSCGASSETFSLPPLAPSDAAAEVALAVPQAREPFDAKQPDGQKPGRCYSLAYPRTQW